MFKYSNGISRRAALALVAASGLSTMMGAAPAVAQDWPTRAVTMVVPYGPGASNDTFTRAVSQILSNDLGQPFVVDNRPGAGGFLGANSVKTSDPDGYTFLESPNVIASLGPIAKLDIDPVRHFVPVGLMATSPTAMVVNADVPANTVEEFIAYAKANPTSVFYGFAGNGTTQHQHGELFKSLTGLDTLQGVAYKSSADAQGDLVAGRLQVMFATVASTLGQIESGQLKLLAYANANVPDTAPKAPTMAEAGVKGFEGAQVFWAVFGPAGLPDDIRDKMNASINKALAEPSIKELMAKSGAAPSPGTPDDLAAVVKTEQANLAEFVKNVKFD